MVGIHVRSFAASEVQISNRTAILAADVVMAAAFLSFRKMFSN